MILSKDNRSWGSFFYEPKHDVVRTPIKLRDIPLTDQLTYDFINNTKNSSELVLNWGKKQLPVKIEFAVDDIVIANMTEELKGPAGFTWMGYTAAANYALQNKTNYEQALKWIDQALVQNRSFSTLVVKSNILKEMSKAQEHEKMMNEALAIATENELNQYGYQLLGNGQVDKAIEIFVLNTKRFPTSANAFDSLGEGFATKGDKKNAILNFKKALSLNPAPNVKINSEKFLKDLGAL